MQNWDEHTTIITDNQSPNCTNAAQTNLDADQMEVNVPQMDISAGKEEQTLSSRLPSSGLPHFQSHVYHPQENLNAFCYDFHKAVKVDPNQLLDEVTLSEDEDTGNCNKLCENSYNVEMKKIAALYEEDEGTTSMNCYTGTKNEIDQRQEIPVPYELTQSDVLIPCGRIYDIVEDKVIIHADTHTGILDFDNIIFNSNKFAVGYLDDVIGKIDQPFYVIKFFPNLLQDNKYLSLNLCKDQNVFYCQGKASLLPKEKIAHDKGCDASNAFDEELDPGDGEFSDDEEEIQVKSEMRKNRRKGEAENFISSNKRQKIDSSNSYFAPEYKKQQPEKSAQESMMMTNFLMMMNPQIYAMNNPLSVQPINPFIHPSNANASHK